MPDGEGAIHDRVAPHCNACPACGRGPASELGHPVLQAGSGCGAGDSDVRRATQQDAGNRLAGTRRGKQSDRRELRRGRARGARTHRNCDEGEAKSRDHVPGPLTTYPGIRHAASSWSCRIARLAARTGPIHPNARSSKAVPMGEQDTPTAYRVRVSCAFHGVLFRAGAAPPEDTKGATPVNKQPPTRSNTHRNCENPLAMGLPLATKLWQSPAGGSTIHPFAARIGETHARLRTPALPPHDGSSVVRWHIRA